MAPCRFGSVDVISRVHGRRRQGGPVGVLGQHLGAGPHPPGLIGYQHRGAGQHRLEHLGPRRPRRPRHDRSRFRRRTAGRVPRRRAEIRAGLRVILRGHPATDRAQTLQRRNSELAKPPDRRDGYLGDLAAADAPMPQGDELAIIRPSGAGPSSIAVTGSPEALQRRPPSARSSDGLSAEAPPDSHDSTAAGLPGWRSDGLRGTCTARQHPTAPEASLAGVTGHDGGDNRTCRRSRPYRPRRAHRAS